MFALKFGPAFSNLWIEKAEFDWRRCLGHTPVSWDALHKADIPPMSAKLISG
jgi:hypothetical protein